MPVNPEALDPKLEDVEGVDESRKADGPADPDDPAGGGESMDVVVLDTNTDGDGAKMVAEST